MVNSFLYILFSNKKMQPSTSLYSLFLLILGMDFEDHYLVFFHYSIAWLLLIASNLHHESMHTWFKVTMVFFSIFLN